MTALAMYGPFEVKNSGRGGEGSTAQSQGVKWCSSAAAPRKVVSLLPMVQQSHGAIYSGLKNAEGSKNPLLRSNDPKEVTRHVLTSPARA